MTIGEIEVHIAVAGAPDSETLVDETARLCSELEELDVDGVGPVAFGEAPPGSKGLELAALGALIVKLGRSGEILRQVVDVVRDWLHRNDSQSVRLEIDGDVLEITKVSEAERKALIDAWIERHARQ